MNAIHLTTDELGANQRGVISQQQQAALQRQRLIWLMGSAGLVLLLALAVFILFLKLADPSFASRGELWVALPIGMFWLWRLGASPLQWLRAGRDLAQGQVAIMEGPARPDIGGGFGMVHTSKYFVSIGAHRFRVPSEIFAQFRPGDSYRIYYAPASKMFLGALLLTPSETHAANTTTSSAQSLAEPLTAQEREILRLIAEGLSNKEIASRLSLSTNTIKMYTSQIYRKLGVSRRTEAVACARTLNLL